MFVVDPKFDLSQYYDQKRILGLLRQLPFLLRRRIVVESATISIEAPCLGFPQSEISFKSKINYTKERTLRWLESRQCELLCTKSP